MLRLAQSFKCDYSSNFDFIITFKFRTINVAVYVAMKQFEFFPLTLLVYPSNAMYMPCESLNLK